MSIKYDIYYINWIKSAFVASLRSAMGIIASGTVGNPIGLTASDTQILLGTPVAAGTFLPGDLLIFDNELVKVSEINLNNQVISGMTVQRGVERTVARPYPSGFQFGKSWVHPKFIWLPNEEQTRIQIYTAFPIRNFKSPTIVVDVNGGEASVSYVGPQEQIGEYSVHETNDHIYFSGILSVRVEIKIYSNTMTDIEKLSDYVIMLLRFVLRDKLAELRLGYTSISFNGISTEEFKGQLLYTSAISISNVTSEYELIFPKVLLEFISQVNIKEIIKTMNSEISIETRVP